MTYNYNIISKYRSLTLNSSIMLPTGDQFYYERDRMTKNKLNLIENNRLV